MSTFNGKISDLRNHLETVSQQNSVNTAVEKFLVQAELKEEKEINRIISFAFVIPIALLIAALVYTFLSYKKARRNKKVLQEIENVFNGSLRKKV